MTCAPELDPGLLRELAAWRRSEGVREGSGRSEAVQHEADRRDVDHRLGRPHLVLVVPGEAAVAAEPGEAALHDPGRPDDAEGALAAPHGHQAPALPPL